MASQTTLLPRPSIQLMAAGFLSLQAFPLRLRMVISGKRSESLLRVNSTPLDELGNLSTGALDMPSSVI